MKTEVRVLVYLRRLDLFCEELCEVVLLFEQAHNLSQSRKNQDLVLEELTHRVNRGLGVVAGRDEDASNLGTRHETSKMLRDLGLSYRVAVPFHFNEVQGATKLNHAIDLLNGPFPSIADQMERFVDENAIGLEERLLRAVSSSLPRSCAVAEVPNSAYKPCLAFSILEGALALLHGGSLRFCEARLSLFFMGVVHSCEGILLIDDFTDAGDKALGLELIIGPARIEVCKVHDTPEHLTSLAKNGFPLRVSTERPFPQSWCQAHLHHGENKHILFGTVVQWNNLHQEIEQL